MAILARLLPSSDELTELNRILRRSTDLEMIDRIHRERRGMRVCCYGTLLCLGLFNGFTLAVIVRWFRGYQDPLLLWAMVLIPTIGFTLQFMFMFHVERLYRKVGL
jgi:hypothetical protein